METKAGPKNVFTNESKRFTTIQKNIRNLLGEDKAYLKMKLENNEGFVHFSVISKALEGISVNDFNLETFKLAAKKELEIDFPDFILVNSEKPFLYLPYSVNDIQKIINDNREGAIGRKIVNEIFSEDVDFSSQEVTGNLVFYRDLNPFLLGSSKMNSSKNQSGKTERKSTRTTFLERLRFDDKIIASKVICAIDKVLFHKITLDRRQFSIHEGKRKIFTFSGDGYKFYFNSGIVTFSNNTWWFVAQASEGSKYINVTNANKNYSRKEGKTNESEETKETSGSPENEDAEDAVEDEENETIVRIAGSGDPGSGDPGSGDPGSGDPGKMLGGLPDDPAEKKEPEPKPEKKKTEKSKPERKIIQNILNCDVSDYIDGIWKRIMSENSHLKDESFTTVEEEQQHFYTELISWDVLRFFWNTFNKSSINDNIFNHLAEHLKLSSDASETEDPEKKTETKTEKLYEIVPLESPEKDSSKKTETKTETKPKKVKPSERRVYGADKEQYDNLRKIIEPASLLANWKTISETIAPDKKINPKALPVSYPQLSSKIICLPICMNSLFTDFGSLSSTDTIVINRYGIFVVNNQGDKHKFSNLKLSRTSLFVEQDDFTLRDSLRYAEVPYNDFKDSGKIIRDKLLKFLKEDRMDIEKDGDKSEDFMKIREDLLEKPYVWYLNQSSDRRRQSVSAMNLINKINASTDVNLCCFKGMMMYLSEAKKHELATHLSTSFSIFNDPGKRRENKDIVESTARLFDGWFSIGAGKFNRGNFLMRDANMCLCNISNLLNNWNRPSMLISNSKIAKPLELPFAKTINNGLRNAFENYPKRQTIRHDFVVRNSDDIAVILLSFVPSETIFRKKLIIDSGRMNRYGIKLINELNRIFNSFKSILTGSTRNDLIAALESFGRPNAKISVLIDYLKNGSELTDEMYLINSGMILGLESITSTFFDFAKWFSSNCFPIMN